MTPNRTDGDIGLRLAFLYASLFIAIGIQLPFFPLWLNARGLGADAIGVVLAIPILMRIAAVPVISRAVDRGGDLRAGLIVTAFASAAGFGLVGLVNGFGPILIAVALASIAAGPIMSLADTYALKGLTAGRRSYGPVRLWGSIAFIAANLATGLLLAEIAAEYLIWLIVAAFGLFGLATLWLKRLEPTQRTNEGLQTPVQHLWFSRNFLVIAAAASLIQASHSLYYGFSAVDWTGKGISSVTVGLLWAIGVAAEIALFALSGRLPFNPATLLMLGAAGAAIRWVAMSFDPPMGLLVLIQGLHGLSFGATHLGSIQWVARMAGDKGAAAAQGDFSTILALGSAAAAGISGLLYYGLGDSAYFVMAGMAGVGLACLVLTRPRN